MRLPPLCIVFPIHRFSIIAGLVIVNSLPLTAQRAASGNPAVEATLITPPCPRAIIPGSAVTEGGLEFYVVAENAPFNTTFPSGGPNRPLRVNTESPHEFKLDPVVRNPGLGFKSGESIDFLLTLSRGTVFRDGKLLSQDDSTLQVHKVGFERIVYLLAFRYPFIYGLIAVVIAAVAGLITWAIFGRRD